MKYLHVKTGSVDSRDGWIGSYSEDELEDRGLTAEQAFDADKGETLCEVPCEPVNRQCSKCGAVSKEIPFDNDLHAVEVIKDGYRQEIRYNAIDQCNHDTELIAGGACPVCMGWEDGQGSYIDPARYGQKVSE